MTLESSLAVIALAALIHASFQLSVSVLTLMSSHAIGARTRHLKLMRLMTGYTAGAATMTILLITLPAFLLTHFYGEYTPLVIWSIACGSLVGIGISVWRFYYCKGRGTTLWLPRSMARFLQDRSKATKRSAEAFSLGLSALISELIFIAGPLLIATLALVHLSPVWQLVGIALYTSISLLPLLIVSALVGGGHKLSTIQKWREDNKRFLQFASGTGLLVLSAYVYVDQIMATTVLAVGGR